MAQVQFLVEELRSQKPRGMTKRNKTDKTETFIGIQILQIDIIAHEKMLNIIKSSEKSIVNILHIYYSRYT